MRGIVETDQGVRKRKTKSKYFWQQLCNNFVAIQLTVTNYGSILKFTSPDIFDREY